MLFRSVGLCMKKAIKCNSVSELYCSMFIRFQNVDLKFFRILYLVHGITLSLIWNAEDPLVSWRTVSAFPQKNNNSYLELKSNAWFSRYDLILIITISQLFHKIISMKSLKLMKNSHSSSHLLCFQKKPERMEHLSSKSWRRPIIILQWRRSRKPTKKFHSKISTQRFSALPCPRIQHIVSSMEWL